MTDTLKAFHAETCHQLLVVTVPTLDGQPLEAYSLSLANQIGAGYEGFNNGLLLLIAPNDRMARIEVGCGLEDVISDEQAATIMRDQLLPAFRAGDPATAIRDGMQALMIRARAKVIPKAYRPAGCPKPT